MKKLILIIFIFILTIQITFAVCCQDTDIDNCYPEKDICCGNPEEGYVGCKVAKIDNPVDRDDYYYYCSGENFYGCLECVCTDTENCEWESSEICEDEGGNCYIEYTPNTEIPKNPTENVCTTLCGEGQIKENDVCVDIDEEDIGDAECYNKDCMTRKYCCETDGHYDKDETGRIEGAVCSGDSDDDTICNYYDNCINVKNTNQDDSDGDCPAEKISFSENCGTACDLDDDWCESSYTTRQCCNDEYGILGYTTGVEPFYGFFDNDCPKEAGLGIGCWGSCTGSYGGEEVTYEAGKCIDGERIIKIIDQDGNIIDTIKEPCSGIPLIPFFTNLNLIFSLLILTLFYFFKER